MCGRFTLTYPDGHLLALALGVDASALAGWAPRFNIAPTQEHPIVLLKGEDRHVVRARWGLANDWAMDANSATRTININARAETLSERPSFREAFERRRCVVPADGFYEWQGTRGERRPYWFHRPRGGLLLLAGLFERRQQTGGAVEYTFTIVTTEANATVGQLHNRMPVILGENDADDWMFARTERERLRRLLRPAPEGWLATRAVSTAVNSVETDGAGLIEPAAEQARLL